MVVTANQLGVTSALGGRYLDPALVKQLVTGDPPGWAGLAQPDLYPDHQALGVVCLREEEQRRCRDKDLEELIRRGQCVVILKQNNNDYIPNVEAVCRLINFLVWVRKRAHMWDGNAFLNGKRPSGPVLVRVVSGRTRPLVTLSWRSGSYYKANPMTFARNGYSDETPAT